MYALKIDDETAKILSEALSLYSRLKIGQIEELSNIFPEKEFDQDNLDKNIYRVKKALFPELPMFGCYGIYNKKVPNEAKIAYDVHKKLDIELNKFKSVWKLTDDKFYQASNKKIIVERSDEVE